PRIRTEGGRDHLVGRYGGDQIAYHLLLAQAELAGAGSVDVDMQRRIVQILRDEDIVHPGYPADPGGQLRGRGVRKLQVRTAHLHVDGRGHTEIQHRIDESAG